MCEQAQEKDGHRRHVSAALDRVRSQAPFRLDLQERNRQDSAFRATDSGIARIAGSVVGIIAACVA